MATELCTACGCGIVNNSTPAGRAVRHSDKLYCPECAELILSPEDLARLSQTASSRAPASRANLKAVGSSAKLQSVDAEESFSEEGLVVRSPRSRRTTGQPNQRPGSRRETASVGDRATSARGRRRATSVVSGRDSSIIDAREQSRSGKNENARAKKREADNTLLYIILGVCAVALCAVGYFVFLRGDAKPDKKKTVAAAPEDSDKTSSTEYARRAEDYIDKKDNIHAAEMYRKAADKAEKEKNFDQARIYSMKIVSLEKSSTINSLNGGK